MSNKASFSNKIVDRQTKRQVYASSLTEFSLAGWVNFQDSQYTPSNKLTISDGVASKLTYEQPVLFPQFDREPQIGSTKYPIWDFTDQKIISYPENNLGNCSARVQFVVEAITSAAGVAVEIALVVPNFLTIFRETKPIVKGTDPQRLTFNLPFFYDQNTIDNGVEIYLTPLGDNIRLYNSSIQLKNW
ncbi:hypothetical protein [Pseudoalteromonas phage PH357]|nr:hypothetical protein [Pseudoalteromonas phage PH357]